jgi:TrmH family RNA methyltransferase
MEIINSIKDSRVIFARELSTSKGRIMHEACLLEGKEQILWAISHNCFVQHVFVHDKIKDDEFIKTLESHNISFFSVTDGILKKITDTVYLVPFVGVASIRHLMQSPDQDFIVVLDNLQDHGNIGTIIRSASAFGINDIIFTNLGSDAFFKKTIDASRGTIFNAHFKKYPSGIEAVKELQKQGYQVVATSPHAKNIQSLIKLEKRPVALVVGNESDGSSDEVLNAADIIVQIPMYSSVESLNVSIAASISIYELQIKLLMAMIKDKIEERIGRNLSITLQLIRQVFDSELKKVGEINSSQLILLMILVFDRTMTYAQITHDIGKAGSELDELLQPLLDGGYIQRELVNKEQAITILPLGHELIAKLWPVSENTQAKILEGLSDEEKKLLKIILSKIQDNCQKILNLPR